MTSSICASGRTHRGGRRQNQDAFAIHVNEGVLAAVVVDGVGGEVGGRLAGRLGARAAMRSFVESEIIDPACRLRAAAAEAHRAILEARRTTPGLERMAATMVAAATDGCSLWLIWLGDSPAYLVRGTSVRRLTRPHNRHTEDGPVITRYLGAPSFNPDERQVRPWPGDRIVLCSDGAMENLQPEDLVGLIRQQAATDAARSLVRAALRRGTSDNATAVVIALPGETGGALTRLTAKARETGRALLARLFSRTRSC